MIINLKEKGNDLVELVDTINDCTSKLSFIAEFFTHGTPGFNFEISEKGTNGIHHILREIQEELYIVMDELDHKIKKDPEAGKKRAAAELKDLTKK
jgi:cob(I)alamin adenosyltransferase